MLRALGERTPLSAAISGAFLRFTRGQLGSGVTALEARLGLRGCPGGRRSLPAPIQSLVTVGCNGCGANAAERSASVAGPGPVAALRSDGCQQTRFGNRPRARRHGDDADAAIDLHHSDADLVNVIKPALAPRRPDVLFGQPRAAQRKGIFRRLKQMALRCLTLGGAESSTLRPSARRLTFCGRSIPADVLGQKGWPVDTLP